MGNFFFLYQTDTIYNMRAPLMGLEKPSIHVGIVVCPKKLCCIIVMSCYAHHFHFERVQSASGKAREVTMEVK